MSLQGPTRTVGQLFRDCLRLVNHVSGRSAKGQNLRRIVGGEFRKNMKEEDPGRIDALKGNAMRALSNYLMVSPSVQPPPCLPGCLQRAVRVIRV